MADESSCSPTSISEFSFFFEVDENSVRVGDVLHHLKTNRVVISGGRDRRGGPIITFPGVANTEFVAEEFDKLMRFVSSVPSEDSQDIGFSVIADMRNKDLPSTNALLKHLQRSLPVKIHTVFILKPHSFWQKSRTSMSHKMSKTKYNFEVIMLSSSLELHKFIDARQLTEDFQGELQHDQNAWIEMQMALESLANDITEIGSRYHRLDTALSMSNVATSPEEADTRLTDHDELKLLYDRSVLQPVCDRFSELARKVYHSSEDGKGNPDFAAARTRLGSLLEKLDSKRRKLEVKWEKRRDVLEQCVQWMTLEMKVDELLDWIGETSEDCKRDCTSIGTSPATTEQLITKHQQLEDAAKEKCSGILDVVVSEAATMLENGHYATEDVKVKSDRLQHEYSDLSEALTIRNALLYHALAFHTSVFQFMHNVIDWKTAFEEKSIDQNVAEVELQIRNCKKLRETVVEEFSTLKQKGGTLIELLQNMAEKAQIDDDTSANHVKQLLVKASEEKQMLETLWQKRMRDLSQGLGLRLFEKEALKVHDWLDESGFSFFTKNKGVGNGHDAAVALLSEHKSFESNAQIMNSTAHKLLASSEDLASSGQCDPDQIRSVADQLEERMHDLMARSERRREQLEMSVAFQKTVNELLGWMDQVEKDAVDTCFPVSVDDAKLMINDAQLKRNHSAVQTANTLAQGQSLINKLIEPLENTGGSLLPYYYETRKKIGSTMEELQERHAHVDSQLADRKMKLDVCLVLRTFEEASRDHLQEIDEYFKHCQSQQLAPNVDGAATMFHTHTKFTEAMEEAYTYITETGHSLLSRLSESNIQLATSMDAKPAVVHVRSILDDMAEKFSQAQAAGMARANMLEQCLQLRDYETNVAQVTGAIADSYSALVSKKRIVGKSLERAEALLADHEEFEVSIEIMADNVQELVSQAADFEGYDHYDIVTIQQLATSIQNEWTVFAEAVDNRHSLLTMSHDVHRHHDDLTSQSVALQKEFGNMSVPDSVAHVNTVIEQHKQQKDFFVQECDRFVSDANYLIEQLKEFAMTAYCDDHGRVADEKYEENMQRVQVMLEGMGARQRKTLRLWQKQHRVLEQHHEILGFMDDAKRITDWVYNCKESIAPQNSVGNSADVVEKLICDLEQYESQEIQSYHDKTVHLMEKAAELQKFDHCDTDRLKVRLAVLNSSWQDLEDKLMKHKKRLKLSKQFYEVLSEFQTERDHILQFLNKLTDRTDVCESSCCAQNVIDDLAEHKEQVMPSLNSKLLQLESLSKQIEDSRIALRTELVAAHCLALASDMADRAGHLATLKEQHVQIEKEKDDKKRQEKKRDLLLEEMIVTEDRYVNDMAYVLKHYQEEMDRDGPIALMGKDNIVMGNMGELLQFHQGTFLSALKEAGHSSEEVAKCFVTWESNLLELYLSYCKTKPHSETLLAEKGQQFLTEWQVSRGHNIGLGAYLIKPVQRITRYHLILQELAKYCQRLKDPMVQLDKALQIMLEIPKKANDVMNFSMVKEYEGNSDSLGRLYHQDTFTVVDSKILWSKEKEQQLFCFREVILVCKCVRDQLGSVTGYLHRFSMKTREMIVVEFIEGEPCKFGISTGKSQSEMKYIFKAKTIEAKQDVVKTLRHIVQQVQPIPGHLSLERGLLRRSFKVGKKKKGAGTPQTPDRPGLARPTLAAALASIITGDEKKGITDAEGFVRPLHRQHARVFDSSAFSFPSDQLLADKAKAASSKSKTLNPLHLSRNARQLMTTSSVPEPLSERHVVDSLNGRDLSGTLSEDHRPRSNTVFGTSFSRSRVVRIKRVNEASVVKSSQVKQDVGVLKRLDSPPRRCSHDNSASSPVLLHRSSATAVLIPRSRSVSCTTVATANKSSSIQSELPGVVGIRAGLKKNREDAEALTYSVSDGDVDQVM